MSVSLPKQYSPSYTKLSTVDEIADSKRMAAWQIIRVFLLRNEVRSVVPKHFQKKTAMTFFVLRHFEILRECFALKTNIHQLTPRFSQSTWAPNRRPENLLTYRMFRRAFILLRECLPTAKQHVSVRRDKLFEQSRETKHPTLQPAWGVLTLDCKPCAGANRRS